MDLTVIVPTFNESSNVAELVRRAAAALTGIDAEILFVDDSTDDTPAEVARAAATAGVPVRIIHRDTPTDGLGGAVMAGLRAAASDVCIVMDGDLQHPPETIPALLDRWRTGDVDLVAASRYVPDGSASGLADRTRVLVSRAATAFTRAMFPIRLRGVSDPMTGFFLVDRRALTLDELRPRGFKILLEILARRSMRAGEIPFRFGERYAGTSKATFRQGVHFLAQLIALRFGKMSIFAVIGGLGAIVNLAIMWALIRFDVGDIPAAIVAAEITIIGNFLLQERFVFQDMREDASRGWVRFAKSFAFNNAELVVRIPVLALLINSWHVSAVLASAITLAVAFVVRFLFHSLVVYAPRRAGRKSFARELAEELDQQAIRPGEL